MNQQTEWVTAADALTLLKPKFSPFQAARRICERAHAGLIRARAESFQVDGRARENFDVPKEFWWAEGHEALKQDWEAGDFSTWIERRSQWKAFGVTFNRADLEKLLPPGTKPAPIPRQIDDEDKVIIQKLGSIVPTAALSYEQAMRELGDDTRVSYRGPALELREALREVLDHLAPDTSVTSEPTYTPEKDQNGKDRGAPTMAQKVRYIMKQKRLTNAAPEQAVVAFEEAISKLTRAVYQLSSKATHVASERTVVVQIRRYLVAILHEPPRVFRRLLFVRGWSHDNEETKTSIFARAA